MSSNISNTSIELIKLDYIWNGPVTGLTFGDQEYIANTGDKLTLCADDPYVMQLIELGFLTLLITDKQTPIAKPVPVKSKKSDPSA